MIQPSLCYVSVPQECANKPFSFLFKMIVQCMNIIPIGLLRDEIDPSLGNRLPFIITNPVPSFIVRSTDLVYVLATPKQLS